jgi:hypothetical protein
MILQQGSHARVGDDPAGLARGNAMTPAPSLESQLAQIGEKQPPLSPTASVLIGLAALVTVSVPFLWLLVRYVDTIPHEGAHAVTGSAIGRTVLAVTLTGSGGGQTDVEGGGIAGNILIYFVGYLGPSAFGLGAAKLIEVGHIVAVLWLTLILLAVLLFVLRGVFSYVPVLIVGGLIYFVARYAAVSTETVVAYGAAWFLLLSGVRKVIYRGIEAADAGKLREITSIAEGFWVLLWLAGSVAAVALGGSWLV